MQLNSPVNESSLGDFPWFWQSGTNFNGKTFSWLNTVFSYSSDGYVGSNGEALTTALFNVYETTAYKMDAADNNAYNAALVANAAAVNTIITDWTTTQGAFPSSCSTTALQLLYVETQVLSWGNPGLTLAQLRSSVNPTSLLPNIPLGCDQIVDDLMTYFAATSSIANIEAAVASANNQLNQVKNNLLVKPATPAPGYMTTVADDGTTQVEPAIGIAESTAVIQNNLMPAQGTGRSFSASVAASNQKNNTVKITAEGGAAGEGDVDFLLTFFGESGSSMSIFSADGSQAGCTIILTFNGVTTVTPQYAAYNISTSAGWWDPDPIAQAAAANPNVSGYQFNPQPTYNFAVDGNFGAISRLMISQQPIISLVYSTSNYSAYEQTFQSQARFSVRFLGIPLAGGASSYYQCKTSYDAAASTVTVTMTPVGVVTPVATLDSLATVIGAQIVWPGAPTHG